MQELKDFSEDIYKCTKCGLCQSVCPIFEQTGLETSVSRGKFTMLNGLLKGDLKLTKNFSKHFDLCLNCNACTQFCPSGIDAQKIITLARYEAMKANKSSPIKCLIPKLLCNKLLMKIISGFIEVYRTLGYFLPAKLLNFALKKRFTRQIELSGIKKLLKVAYFPGCVNTYINPTVKNAVITVLRSNGIEPVIADFSCCGMPSKNAGDLKTFINQAIKNLDKIDENIDYLITDCATCGAVWDSYAGFLEDEYNEKAQKIASKAMNIYKFLEIIDIKIPNGSFDYTVTYHDPCHLKNIQKIHQEPRNLLKKIKGINFVEMNEAGKCCGAAGSFCVYHREISQKISKRKAQNIIASEAQVVATSCPSCEIGIKKGLLEIGEDRQIKQPIEILAELYL